MQSSLKPQEPRMQGPLILAIDDSEIALEMIVANLAEFGLTNAITFNDPSAALAQLRAGTFAPDLILMDVMMPKINGIEACAAVRSLEGLDDVPIVMLTSLENMNTLSRAFLAGANDYVTKPFEPIELEARIKNGLRLGSELRRRKSSEARLMAELRSRSTAVSLNDDQCAELLISRSMFDTAVRNISPQNNHLVCLIILALSKGEELPVRREFVEPDGLARILGDVKLPANSLLARIESNLYCILAIDVSEDAVRLAEENFVSVVASADFKDPLDPFGRSLVLKSAAMRPRANYPVSAALADGIRKVRGLGVGE